MKNLLLYFLLLGIFNLSAQINSYSLEFDGNNFNSNDGRVECGNINLGNNFTVSYWVKDSDYLGGDFPSFHELLEFEFNKNEKEALEFEIWN